ncbi:cytochrome P450 [Athelia psychrophila]|uniref:Cytochrome P450 n=1 Tax=Athelia psychrophila TaxID=1759441 RepID=A0A166LSD5_9AGAM|nr:cytochrome P450 [Fibularhizoctonia sp. CBS 109695]
MDVYVASIAVAIVSLAVAALSYLASTKASRYPPGPKGWPLIGNLFDAPKAGSEWVDYHEMCKKYNSDVVYMKILGQSILVLDSLEAITELLDKRSNIYSSRPRFVMFVELQSDRTIPSRRTALMGYSCGYLDLKAKTSGQSIFDTPGSQIGATIIDTAYGIKALPEDDPVINLADEAVRLAGITIIPGRFLVETLPILKYVPAWFPGASFQRVAQEGKAVGRDLVEVPFDQVKRAMADGTAQPSFALNCLQRINLGGDVEAQETAIKGCAATMFGAGADTTVSTLATFFLAMMKYPEVQAKAQRELDSVLGFGQLPDFGDEDSLPYITAMVKECLRWEVVSPIAVPHLSTADDEYKGYHIPAGTLVIPNSWAVLNDENTYPDPFTFNPDRFMTDGNLDPEAAFGYGRRICPGRHMARDTIWINIGCILACFNIEKPLDAHGNTVEPSVNYISQLVRHPEAFDCRFKPRSKYVEDMIRGL